MRRRPSPSRMNGHSVLKLLALFIIFIHGQPCLSEPLGKVRATRQQESAYDEEVKRAEEYVKLGDYDNAIQCLKKSSDIPHSPEYGTLLRILSAVSKRPMDPDGHIALGLYYMNHLDERFNIFNLITERSYSPQADYELNAAIDLSPNHKNPEAERHLARLSVLKARALAVPDKWSYLRNFYKELFAKSWTPPNHTNPLIARADVDAEKGKTFIIVASASKDFDDSVLKVLSETYQEFPFLDWSFNNACWSFMSNGSAKIIDDNKLSILKFHWLRYREEPLGDAKTIGAEFIAKYITAERLNRYCKNDTKFAYKIMPRAPFAHRILDLNEEYFARSSCGT